MASRWRVVFIVNIWQPYRHRIHRIHSAPVRVVACMGRDVMWGGVHWSGMATPSKLMVYTLRASTQLICSGLGGWFIASAA